MSDQTADDALRLQDQLEAGRGVWDGHWREVAERVRPNQNNFQQIIRTDGEKRTERLFDSTAVLGLNKYTAAVISLVMPANQQWHTLQGPEDLADNQEVNRWLQEVTKLLFRVRYNPHAAFQGQVSECVADNGAFGNGVLFIDDLVGVGIRYKAFPLAQTYFCEDAYGRIDRVNRKFQYTAHQAASMFGLNNCSDMIKQAYEKQSQEKFWFLHAVGMNGDYSPGAILHPTKGKKFKSCYIDVAARKTMSEGGFRKFPFAIARCATSPGEVYGRGPAMDVLPTIKMINEMKKTTIRAAQRALEPPLMLSDDASLQAFSLQGGSLNYGYLGQNGEPLAKPLVSGVKIEIGLDMMNAEREIINDAFLVTLFRILVEEPQITATEAMLRAQEKGELLAPTMGRMQTDFCGALIERELDILAAAGRLPPMPEALLQYGGEYMVNYTSPLALAQRAGEGVAILSTIESLAPMVQIDSTIMQRFDLDGAAKTLAEIKGFPAKHIRSDEEMTAIKEKAASEAQAQQLLAAAPVAASAAKDLAQAGSLAASAPNQVAPNLGLQP